MNDVMHGIGEDVRFNHSSATLLASRCRSAATLIEGQAESRASWVTHAMEDFRGRYSELFRGNGNVQAADARLLVSRLREVATGAEQLAREATSEQTRRETARAWKQRQADRGFWDHVADWFTGGEDPPVGPAAQPVSLSFAQSEQGVREPLSGTGATGTSSARPANLRSFATNSAGADEALATRPGSLRDAHQSFTAGCGWGSLEAEGVWAGFDRYLTANGEDVRWATTVAAAFETAGGEGVVTLPNAAINAALQAAGVDSARQQLTIDPPQAYGAPPTTGYANDPVNTATGNFLEPEVDLGFTGGCATLRLSRMYNSLDRRVGAFGPGWSSWTDAGLAFDAEGATWTREDGRQVLFPRQGEGWARSTSEAFWLGRAGDGHAVTDNAGGRWRFDAAGHLVTVARGAGTEVELAWPEGRLAGLAHERGRSLALEWAGDRVVAVTASDGRRVEYGYDASGRLVTASTPGATRRYDWNDAGLIGRVTDADGVVEAENTFDDLGRVLTQLSRHGRVTAFTYLPGRATVVADADGSRSNTWLHDPKGRLVGVVDAEGRRQSMAYDRQGNLVMATARDGQVTVSEFDDRGRTTTRVLPSGARVETSHDEADRPVRVTVDNGGTICGTTYSYARADRNPSTMTDAEGGVTRFEWAGNLLRVVEDPTGVRVTFEHDRHGDLVGTTDALGHTARLERDGAGRVVAAVTPSGNRTTFTYDARGVLTSRTAPDGGVWRFEHSPAGRLTATVDPTGARTEIGHDAAGEAARTTDPLGRTVVRAFDDLGNLARVELPDGSAWDYAHDALSRMSVATDPEGGQWRHEYDANGGLAAMADPTDRGASARTSAGVTRVTRGEATAVVRTDTLGRIVSVQAPDGSNTLTRHDKCGRPVEYVDADGHVTGLERDAGGRIVGLRRPDGSTTRYAYDACGRLESLTDASGALTTFTYTADGHLASETDPTGAVTSYSYDACGRLLATHAPGRGSRRWGYDSAGRVVRATDTLWGLRRFRYDAGGQLVEATNALGGVTRYEYDALGRMVRIADPLGGVTTRTYNPRGQVTGETDPLGRTISAGYDAAGRAVWQQQPTGERLEWHHDDWGNVSDVRVDGSTVAEFACDVAQRTLKVRDHTRPGRVSEHRLAWNSRGQLVQRSRDGARATWDYDGLGHCRRMGRPDGTQTRYEYDPVGRLAAITTDGLGTVSLTRDAAGRLTSAEADGVSHEWAHADGFVVGHESIGPQGRHSTTIERDRDGRIVAMTFDGLRTRYRHDEAHQLVGAETGQHRASWVYDVAGRLVTEQHNDESVDYLHDEAGQLVRIHEGAGSTELAYDAAGRRVSQEGPHGRIEYTWGRLGWLSAVSGPAGTVSLHVDALGELQSVGSADVFWNTASQLDAPIEVDGAPVTHAPGLTGTRDGWTASGWRTARAAGEDPWGIPHAAASSPSLAGSGELSFCGLEWLGARVYDPATRGFLSVDPLDPIAGATWGHNPYSFAGNDPLHALDPTGLRPVTDAELQAYRDANQGFLADAGDWLADNWEYLAGGAMVIAGGVLIATGVGGPAGMMLIGAGADTIIQKATTGEVRWDQVAMSGVLGAVGGAGATALAGRAGLTGWRATVAIGAGSGSFEGFGMGGYRYMTGPGPHTVSGFFTAAGTEGLAGGVLGGGGAGIGHGLTSLAGRYLPGSASAPLVANPGALPDDMAITFSGARYTSSTLDTDTVLYRAGTADRPFGQYFASEPPGGVFQTRVDKAIPPVWPDGNPAPIDTAYAIRLPGGTEVHTGTVANQGGLWMGGTEQIVVQQPWAIPGAEVVDSWPLR